MSLRNLLSTILIPVMGTVVLATCAKDDVDLTLSESDIPLFMYQAISPPEYGGHLVETPLIRLPATDHSGEGPYAEAVCAVGDSAIVVLESSPLLFRVYDFEGKEQRSFAPGEAGIRANARSQYGWRLLSVTDTTFVLEGSLPLRRQEWSLSGELISSTVLYRGHRLLYFAYPRYFTEHAGQVYSISSTYQSGPRNRSIETTYLIRTQWHEDRLDTLVVARHPAYSISQSVIRIGNGHFQLLRDKILFTSLDRGYYLNWSEDHVCEFDIKTGMKVRGFGIKDDLNPFVDSLVIRGRTEQEDLVLAPKSWLADHVRYVAIIEGLHREIWIQRTAHPHGGAWPVDVFTPDGSYIGRLSTRARPSTISLASSDVAYGLDNISQPSIVYRLRMVP